MGLKGGSGGLYYLENYYILFETLSFGEGRSVHCTIWKGGVGTTLWGGVGLNHLKEGLSHLWRLYHLRGVGCRRLY